VPAALFATSIPDPPHRCRLYDNEIGDAGAAALSEALKSNATPTKLT
jgi:hypothetical protein